MTADALLAIIAGRDTTGLIEVRCLHKTHPPRQRWFRIGDPAIHRYMAQQSKTRDVFVGAAPRTRREGGKSAIAHAWCLWVDIDSAGALERLRAFTPSPSLVVRSGTGSNVHCYWALTEPLSVPWVERANRRLAYHLGADLKATDAARILRPPGSLSHKSEPPVPVTFDPSTGRYGISVADIVGNLPDPPIRKAPARQPRQDITSDDPLLGISADHYYATLTGREVTYGNVTCPTHKNGEERDPSLRLYDTTFHCFGCGVGGSIYEFGALLWGYHPPVRGAEFMELRDRLTREMGL